MDAAAAAEEGTPGSLRARAHHIKKRALKNKSLAVSFSEKDLKYVDIVFPLSHTNK